MSTPTYDPADHPRAGGGQFTTTPRSEPAVDLDPAAAVDGDYEAGYARVENATRKVAELLPTNLMTDDGGGPTIFFGSRDAADNFGDHAFLRN